MDLKSYFKDKKGSGVLATADDKGKVDIAIYATPHVMDDNNIAFIMADRLTHHNLQSNGNAAYLFSEEGKGFKGIRLYLSKLREEKDSELLYSIRRRKDKMDEEKKGPRYLVIFKVEKILPLIGDDEGKY